MKKLSLMLVGLVLLGSSLVFGATSFDDYTLQQVSQCTKLETSNAASVTDTASTVTFTKDTKALYIENTGANELFYNPSGTATSSSARLDPGQSRAWSGFKTRAVSLIATSSETTTARIEGCY